MKSIVITGAGGGLGRALARAFADEGNTLYLLGRTMTTIGSVATEVEGIPVCCDVGDPDSVRQAFEEISGNSPTLDLLINNAGFYQPAFVRDTTDQQISAAIQTNLAGPVYCCREVIPRMSEGGQIINISSETVALNHAMFSMYQSSKAGLERFSEALREEIRPLGIRVTTARAGQMMDADSRSPSDDPAVLRQFAEENIKRGLDLRARPISSFDSAAALIKALANLPADIHVPEMSLEGWS